MKDDSGSHRISPKMQPVFDSIVELTDGVCKRHLNEEYAELAREITAVLSRKRPSPLLRGDTNVWACGIIYALGYVNFLFDNSREPYLSAEELCDVFGVKKSTGYNKSRVVRDALKMRQFDPRWCLPSLMDENPLVWMIEVDGIVMDARWIPREIQEIAYRKGLIPYIPEKKEKKTPGWPGKGATTEDDEKEELLENRNKERQHKEKPEDPSQLSLEI